MKQVYANSFGRFQKKNDVNEMTILQIIVNAISIQTNSLFFHYKIFTYFKSNEYIFTNATITF